MMFSRYSNTQLLSMVDDCKEWQTIPFSWLKLQGSKTHFHSMSEACTSVIEYAGIPIDIFWMILSFVTLGAATFWIAGIVAAFSFFIAVGVFVYTYHAKMEREKENDEYIDMSYLKIHMLDEIIERSGSSIPYIRPSFECKSNLKIKACITGLSVASILALTFYWGLTDVLVTIGLITATTAATGPIGLAIGLGIAIIAGIYLGMKHYEASVNKAQFKYTKNRLDDEISKKRYVCSFLKDEGSAVASHSFFRPKKIEKVLPRSYSMPGFMK